MISRRISILLTALLLVSALGAQAQKKSRQTREEYIERYKSIAINDMERYGIPASITLAQGILESDCGNSTLAARSNNHFGIKCKSNWTGKKVYHDDDAKGECFRSYASVEESYRDHAEFLDSSPRYDSLFTYASTDYKSWARGLKAAGYATAPDYAQRLIRIIEESELYLLDQPDGSRLYASRTTVGGAVPAELGQAVAAGTIDPDHYRVALKAFKGYNVYSANGVPYILAKPGDTFESVGREFRVSAGNLRKFNDVSDKRGEPAAGQPIFIERKQKRWTGDETVHVCRAGETLYSVSQRYGVRIRSLEKLNKSLQLQFGLQFPDGVEVQLR